MYSNGRDVHESMKQGWNNSGVVGTIFEDGDEDLESLSSSLSFSLSSPSTPLQTGVDAWTVATGRQPDVKIHVGGVCFHMHKDILISRSGYLKRQLVRLSEFTLSPPLKVSVETFKQVADFCYTNHVAIMPSNVAALRTAAELLEMNGEGFESLIEMTESYLCNLLMDNRFIGEVLRSSLTLLPEAEQTAFITSRCIEALLVAVNDGDVSSGDGLKIVSPVDFRAIVESMQQRFTRSHDLLYRTVDLYFQVYDEKSLSEDQKTQISSCINCSILSTPLLMDAVQNPRMPLRFVVQAMLMNQLSTHRSILSKTKLDPPLEESSDTLGAILQHDLALRQVDKMRTTIETTCSKIQTLEKELSFMKNLLSEKQGETNNILLFEDGSKSASFRLNNNTSNSHKVERGERGSMSSSMVRLFGGTNSKNTNFSNYKIDRSPSSLSSYLQDDDHYSPKANVKRSFGQRLIKGLKSAFGGSNNKAKKGEKLSGGNHKNKVRGYDAKEITFDTFAISNSRPYR